MRSPSVEATAPNRPTALSRRRETARARIAALHAGLVLVLAGLVVASLGMGRLAIPIGTVVDILEYLLLRPTADGSGGAWTQSQWVIVEYVRLPRVLVATISGMGLALCGATLQGLFRNPLVGPEVAGVSHGAAFGGVMAILFGLSGFGVVIGAFAGGVAALAACFGLARLADGGANVSSLILAGMIVGAFFGAAVGVGEFIADPDVQLPTIVFWLLGSFASADWRKFSTLVLPCFFGGTLLLCLRWRINLLSLGDDDASALGLKVGFLRWLIIGTVAMIIAAQVAVSGGVGWVGLVIPHLARMICGPDHRALLPASTLLGGIYLLAMDDIARTLTPQEIPIGLLTAFAGTPVFAILFCRYRAKGWRSG